ncbi:MAG TPA: hypothetical protein VL754_14375 [Verrucomicrobiae bacterium]|nr:hypothetical protein [Verrucomicrobiae bacterium]
MDYARSLLKKIAPRLFRALLGFWLVLGPFIVFLIRWKAWEVTIIFLVLVGAFLFVGFMCWLIGKEYLKQLGSDTFTALASVLIGGGLSGLVAKLTHYSLHLTVLFFPLVIIAGFVISEYYHERKTAAVPAAGPYPH